MNRESDVTVTTVCRKLPLEELGVTLFHEHLYLDNQLAFRPAPGNEIQNLRDKKVSIEDLAVLREYPYSCMDNLRLDEDDTLIWELSHYAKYGGSTIVEVTGWNCGRSPLNLLNLSRLSGINIVMGCGLYRERTHPKWVREKDEVEISELIVEEVVEGVVCGEDDRVYPGVIGEIGISSEFTMNEKKSLRAAAMAQMVTGLPLSVHLPGWERFGHKVIDICEEVGVDPKAIVLDHMDPSSNDPEYHLNLAKRGVFLEFDGIGMGLHLYGEKQCPCDEEISQAILRILDKGYGDRLLLSHDVYLKILLRRYGGNGYGHILRSFIPRLVRHGIDEKTCTSILVENPKRVFVNAAETTI